MNKEKRQALEASGWVFGDAEDFLELTREERDMVELRLAVSSAVRRRRLKQRLTQAQAAKILGTSQPRVAQIEAGARDVTLDLMFRGLFSLGGSIKDVRTTARGKSRLARSASRITDPTTVTKRTKSKSN
jgi:predicted XRE-type DNA-binding protein